MATTIKVSEDLRDRINKEAKAEGLTAASFLEKILESHHRTLRLDSFAEAINSADEEYWHEYEEWDSVASK